MTHSDNTVRSHDRPQFTPTQLSYQCTFADGDDLPAQMKVIVDCTHAQFWVQFFCKQTLYTSTLYDTLRLGDSVPSQSLVCNSTCSIVFLFQNRRFSRSEYIVPCTLNLLATYCKFDHPTISKLLIKEDVAFIFLASGQVWTVWHVAWGRWDRCKWFAFVPVEGQAGAHRREGAMFGDVF